MLCYLEDLVSSIFSMRLSLLLLAYVVFWLLLLHSLYLLDVLLVDYFLFICNCFRTDSPGDLLAKLLLHHPINYCVTILIWHPIKIMCFDSSCLCFSKFLLDITFLLDLLILNFLTAKAFSSLQVSFLLYSFIAFKYWCSCFNANLCYFKCYDVPFHYSSRVAPVNYFLFWLFSLCSNLIIW